ncbi:hypothetical protein SADUNF_Sadunf06G0070900 [Salix dunnii]|uniref:Dynein light chain n=1 Tax=Salix dunnii TaxID=1413687 RepID=A0A835K1E3_9ROSI|nr:hypothetical protein SADUNF_Sadunf06G0070900 [Salix dunnii]
MLEGKAVLRETDMPEHMQSHVMELAYQALDLHEVSDCQSIAHYIKQRYYEQAHAPYLARRICVYVNVGSDLPLPGTENQELKDFGSCITHLSGSFIFFRVEMMEFLIFKDGRDFSESKEEAIGVLQQFQKSDT